MSHVKVVDSWKEENPTTVPADAKNQSAPRAGGGRPLLRHRVRERLPTNSGAAFRRRHDRSNRLGLANLRPRARVRSGETGVTPVLAPKKSAEWNSTIDALLPSAHTLWEFR